MKKISKKIVVSVTAAAFLSLAGVGVWAYAAPYSYVSLDVNPSIEYTLNMFDRVIDVEAVNDDGQAILEDAGELKNLTIEDAITKTVDELVEEGYLPATTSVTDVTETVRGSAVGTDDSAEALQDGASTTTVSEGAATETGTTVEATNETGTTTETVTGSAVDTTTTTGTDATAGTTDTTTTNTTTDTTTTTDNNTDDIVVGGIVITVSNKDGELTDDLVDKIRDAVEDIISQEVEVEVMGVGYARVQEARKLGVTPGKLNLVEKLKASSSDPDSIVISEWVNKPVKEIMQVTKENKKAQIFSTAIQPEETSEAANDDTAVGTVSESTAAVNTDDTNTAEDVNQNAGTINDEDKDDNEDADDQGEDDNENADDQGEDDDEDVDKEDKEIRKDAYKAVKKAEKDAKKEAMKAAKEDSKNTREESREAKKKADEAAKEAKKLAKETAKEANEQIKEAAEEEREAAEKVREASEEDREDADDEDGNGGKDNYGSIRSAEKRNNQNGNGKRR